MWKADGGRGNDALGEVEGINDGRSCLYRLRFCGACWILMLRCVMRYLYPSYMSQKGSIYKISSGKMSLAMYVSCFSWDVICREHYGRI